MKEEKTTKESKQVNFRIDPDSAEAFRQFCTSHGMNQAQGFDHLMQILELNNAKAATPGRIVEIENFERLLKEILSAYINSIELSSNAELRVQEHFRSDLKRKDQTIDELREKIKLMETEKKDSDTAMTALREEQKHLQEQAQYATGQMEAAKKAASDREEMNRILQLQNQELQQKLVRYNALKESEEQAQKEAAALQLKIRELQQTLEHETGQKKNLEQIATQAQQQVREMENQKLEDRMLLADLKRQLSDKDSDTQAMLKQVRMQAELEQERAVIAKEREMQEELRKADRETVRLQAELEQLQLQLTRESTPEQHAKQIPETPDTNITADAAVKNTGRE
ncbi:MAG: hypothetical protein KHY39_08330 [Clostridiaceae bacterium]|nr:hypothetical protein [Clostridiaceae bacterium]